MSIGKGTGALIKTIYLGLMCTRKKLHEYPVPIPIAVYAGSKLNELPRNKQKCNEKGIKDRNTWNLPLSLFLKIKRV